MFKRKDNRDKQNNISLIICVICYLCAVIALIMSICSFKNGNMDLGKRLAAAFGIMFGCGTINFELYKKQKRMYICEDMKKNKHKDE